MDTVVSGQSVQSATNIFRALIGDRLRDKYKAVEALDGPGLGVDSPTLRALLVKSIKEDFYAGKEEELQDPGIAFTRSWLLSALARVSGDDGEATELVVKHLDKEYEPNNWGRYWALEGLVAGRNAQLEPIAQKVAGEEGDPITSMLASAYLGSLKDAKAIRKVRDGLANQQTQWYVLRALRVVFLPATVADICRIVDTALYTDETYDAIMALGIVPSESNHAATAAQSLSGCIVKLRGSPWKDGMRIGAISGLGKLKVESVAPVLLEELADDNPGVVREAARSVERILGLNVAVIRIVEAAVKRGGSGIDAFGRALRWLDREAVAEELGALMVSGSATQREAARMLLSELGGAVAFEKLRARTDAMKQYTDVLEKAEQGVRTLFDRTIHEAQNGFQLAVIMDASVFALGIVLLVGSAVYALVKGGDLSSWAGVGVSGGVGVLGVLYGTLVAKPRRQVRESVDHLMRLKIMFLAYLRRLHQADQAYTRRMLDDKLLSIEEVEWFSEVVARIMESTMEHTERDQGLGRRKNRRASARENDAGQGPVQRT